MKHTLRLSLFLLALALADAGHAFCGFYVARADSRLFNRASQVVLVRDGERTVLTMANDYQGDIQEFALVIPVPTVLRREQINVNDKALIDHLDAYTAPRLVEYHDPDPCQVMELERLSLSSAPAAVAYQGRRAHSLGVTIEATYTVGEYDILILSARQSEGLLTWLREQDYRLPAGAEPVVGSYLRQGMRFFVARVNLQAQAELGYSYLRPLQIAFESPKFMLPIRLGMVNADGPQELFVYALTRTGRVETTNYRTVQLPTDVELPGFVKADFTAFYRDLFTRQVEQEHGRAVFLEYAWDMAWCDPCAADPLTTRELRELGVFWLDPAVSGPAQDVFVTRLHLRYDQDHFPEDLFFQATGDRSNFQGRYILRHPWRGEARCEAAHAYFEEQLPRRRQRAAAQLAELTGWDLDEIRARMPEDPAVVEPAPWWQRLWRQ